MVNSLALIGAKTGMRLNDCIVLATALLEDVDYFVTNDKNFPDTLHGLHSVNPSEFLKLL